VIYDAGRNPKAFERATMIKVGDRLPEGSFRVKNEDGTAVEVPTGQLFGGQTVVLVGVPGAFTSTCHNAHIPQFVANASTLKDKGVDRIVVMAVNDHHVMKAWKEAQKAGPEIDFVADGSAVFTKAAGVENDLVGAGMGIRAKRFAAIVDNGVIRHIAYEPPGGKITVTGAEAMLEAL
jgi:peroxiredoxin